MRPCPKCVGSVTNARPSKAAPIAAALSSRRAFNARKLKTTPLGAPVVPDVKSTRAASSERASTTGVVACVGRNVASWRTGIDIVPVGNARSTRRASGFAKSDYRPQLGAGQGCVEARRCCADPPNREQIGEKVRSPRMGDRDDRAAPEAQLR